LTRYLSQSILAELLVWHDRTDQHQLDE
jgi:hypothetical protein